MNSLNKRKAKALSMALMVSVSLPLGASAQEGLFKRGVADGPYYGFSAPKQRNGIFGQCGSETNLEIMGVIDNQTFGQSVPVGSGVIILLAAGTGYAILKRKEDEK